ncbi:MAG: Crp/Fnr family transcriptional regulator [Syntrophomonadaceae bacterium]|nr:Crp/Fnr family transcriptional regulator [Syntrophomonadaceae bacterium]
MQDQYLSVLAGTGLFADIGRTELEIMMNCMQPRICEFKKNDLITVAGDRFDSIGILLKGEAVVARDNAAGDRTIMNFLKPGDMFGEMVVFSRNSVWPATVIAQEACAVFFLAREKIVGECGNVCSWHQTLIQNMLRIVSERALALYKRVEYLSIRSMRGKLGTFLLEQYQKAGREDFELPMNRNELAEFLNVSRPSMSRELSRMRDEGIIDFRLSRMRIKDLKALRDLAE